MNRKITRLKRLTDPDEVTVMRGTPAERIAMVWPLTQELYSLSKSYDVEQPLQRHVVRVVRGRR
jgi:hypothetical protein